MKLLISVVILALASGCNSIEQQVRDEGIDWDSEDIIGFTFDAKEEGNLTEFRFSENGYLVAVFGVIDDAEDTIAPLMKWKKEKKKLVIYDGLSDPIIYTILELTDTEAVFNTGEFIHKFTKQKTKLNQAR